MAFRTGGGVRLSAWYIPARNGAAVVLLPGAGSTRTSLLGQAAVLARHGYGALLLDTRGHGRSGGHAMDFGWWGNRDITTTVLFLARQPGIGAGKIAVLGESMGGEQALVAVGSDPRIRAVVAEGATGQQLADHGWLLHGIDGTLTRGMEWVQYTAAGLISGAPRPMSIFDAIRAAGGRPMLIIAGGAAAHEPDAARWFRAASPATVQVWVVPHAGHTQGPATGPRACAQRGGADCDRSQAGDDIACPAGWGRPRQSGQQQRQPRQRPSRAADATTGVFGLEPWRAHRVIPVWPRE